MKKLLLFLIFIVISCAPSIKKFDSYQKAQLPKANSMPSSKELENNPIKVAVFPLKENDSPLTEEIDLGSFIATTIENTLTENNLIKLLDKKVADRTEREVALAEISSKKVYEGPVVADYVIKGSLNQVTFSSNYTKKKKVFNIVTQKYDVTPTQHNYQAIVKGNIKIYKIPSLKVIKTFEFQGIAKKSEETSSNQIIAFFTKKDVDYSLIREASKEAIKNIEIDLKTFFAKKGYILEKKVFKNKVIFKINIGKKDGLEHGDKLIIYSKTQEKNTLTDEIEIIEKKIAKGTISNIINDQTSWIIIKGNVNKIKMGDIAQIKN